MDDAASEFPDLSKAKDWKRFRRSFLYFLLSCSIVWIALYSIYRKFPYLQPGSNIVTIAKRSYSVTHPLFDADTRLRILAFGNSKTLAAFNPKVFDANLARDGVTGKVQSVNEAMPGDRRFVVYLDQLLAAGARPTHVLVQFSPIADDHELTWNEWIRHDKMIVDTLFPFRTLPRDFTLFVFAAIGHGGIAGFYRESAQVADQVMRDHGYYFLKGQSHYPGDKLPDDYTLPTDTPTREAIRSIDTALPASVRLAALSKRYGFKVVFFPPVYRTGEFAAAPPRNPVQEVVPHWPGSIIIGDDYWLMPPRYFSDPIHPNPAGADIYSTRLAALLAPMLQQDDR